MAVVIQDMNVNVGEPSSAPQSGDEKSGGKSDAKSPEMARAVAHHVRHINERCLRVRAY